LAEVPERKAVVRRVDQEQMPLEERQHLEHRREHGFARRCEAGLDERLRDEEGGARRGDGRTLEMNARTLLRKEKGLRGEWSGETLRARDDRNDEALVTGIDRRRAVIGLAVEGTCEIEERGRRLIGDEERHTDRRLVVVDVDTADLAALVRECGRAIANARLAAVRADAF